MYRLIIANYNYFTTLYSRNRQKDEFKVKLNAFTLLDGSSGRWSTSIYDCYTFLNRYASRIKSVEG